MRVEEEQEDEQEDEGGALPRWICVTVMTADRSEGEQAGCDSELGSGVVVASAGGPAG